MKGDITIPIWWTVDEGTCYVGRGDGGLEWSRHGRGGKPGFWWVTITGWDASGQWAVMDDFGNLVKVRF